MIHETLSPEFTPKAVRRDPPHTPVLVNVIRTQEAASARPGFYTYVKALVEFAFALILLVFALPVMLVTAVLVRLTSRGPALYTQTRVGKGGRFYTIYKFRSMTHNCERLTGPQWAQENDPRVTPIGNFLRATHLDELPQLWNVLRGDMSLIGPRPERPEFVAVLEQSLPHYRDRLRVRPGITGFAQIQLPPDTDLESVRRKLVCDLYYVDKVDLWLDLRILICTGLQMFGVSFSFLKKALRMPCCAKAEDSYQERIKGFSLALEAQAV